MSTTGGFIGGFVLLFFSCAIASAGGIGGGGLVNLFAKYAQINFTNFDFFVECSDTISSFWIQLRPGSNIVAMYSSGQLYYSVNN